MCRYAQYGPYKRHYACFGCRKGFKRPAAVRWQPKGMPLKPLVDPAPCPDCGCEMSNMGLDFKPSKRRDAEHWEVVEFLFKRGFAYNSCGCVGPGFRPSRWAEVPAFVEEHRRRSAGELLAAKFAARAGVGGRAGPG